MIWMDTVFWLTFSVNYKSYLSLLDSEKKILKNLLSELWIFLKNLLTESLFLNISIF